MAITIKERERALSDLQRAMLREVADLRRSEVTAATSTKAAVAKALDHGVPAALLARSLGVSKPRIYQMRKEARPESGEGTE